MKNNTAATVATYGLICAAAVTTFLLPKTLTVPSNYAADPPSDDVVLNGVVYDFMKSHPDFGVTPAGGSGHYAGNVSPLLSGSRQPIFMPGGYKVVTQWRDGESRPIAPHMAGVRSGSVRETLGFRINGTIELKKEATIDAFDSNFGPYGVMGNYGADAVLSTNSTDDDAFKVENKCVIRGDVSVGAGASPADVIKNDGIITGAQRALDEPYEIPALQVPEDLDAFEPDGEFVNDIFTLTGDMDPEDDSDVEALHFGTLTITRSELHIEGDLRILCDGDVRIDRSQIILEPDANLTIYVAAGDVEIKGDSTINIIPGDTTRVNFNVLGSHTVEIKRSHVYASIIAPQGYLHVKDQGHLYGGFIGERVKIEDKFTGVHVDRGNARTGPWNFAITVREKMEFEDCQLDSFDSNEGAYGGANVSTVAWLSTNTIKNDKVKVKNTAIGGDILVGPGGNPDEVIKLEGGGSVMGDTGALAVPLAIPMIAAPDVGVSVGDREYDGGVHTISADLRCKHLRLKDGAILWIDGNVTIRCDDKLELKDASEIRLRPDSTLTLYVKKDVKLENDCKINMNTGNPQLVSLRRTSVGKKGKVELKNESQLCAWVQGAKTELKLDKSDFYGSFAGDKVSMKESDLHVDMAYLITCVDMGDTLGMEGAESDGGISSAESFDQWYHAVIGLNQVTAHAITLVRDAFGVYEYLDDDFHPVDDRLLGNEGDPHNYHFTYSIGADFVYAECGDQFVEFRGGDGAWLFINNQLVMDLGGVESDMEQYVQIDRLGLQDGASYKLRFFYAQRSDESVFRLRTNLELSSEKSLPGITAMFD